MEDEGLLHSRERNTSSEIREDGSVTFSSSVPIAKGISVQYSATDAKIIQLSYTLCTGF